MSNVSPIDPEWKPRKLDTSHWGRGQAVRRLTSMIKNPVPCCHICEIEIPMEISDVNSPLYGTVDHVFPRSLGGRNHPSNLRPSHFLCNQIKGGSVGISEALVRECRDAVETYAGTIEIPLWDFKENKKVMYKSLARQWWATQGVNYKTETEAVNATIKKLEEFRELFRLEKLEYSNLYEHSTRQYSDLEVKYNRLAKLEDKYNRIPRWIRWFYE